MIAVVVATSYHEDKKNPEVIVVDRTPGFFN
jgi:hypothetical protein